MSKAQNTVTPTSNHHSQNARHAPDVGKQTVPYAMDLQIVRHVMVRVNTPVEAVKAPETADYAMEVANLNAGNVIRKWTCSDCYGDGECTKCGGTGLTWNNFACPKCNGNGECKRCEGSGIEEVECRNCYGSGEIECFRCNGDGECKKCDGQGFFECKRCEGDGKCSRCDGRGYFHCKECRGKGKVREDHEHGNSQKQNASGYQAPSNIGTRRKTSAQTSEYGPVSIRIVGKIDLESNDWTIHPYKNPE